jgi:hypothetical protein
VAGLDGDVVVLIRSLIAVRWIRSDRFLGDDTPIQVSRMHAFKPFGDQTACESSHGHTLSFGGMVQRRDEGA